MRDLKKIIAKYESNTRYYSHVLQETEGNKNPNHYIRLGIYNATSEILQDLYYLRDIEDS